MDFGLTSQNLIDVPEKTWARPALVRIVISIIDALTHLMGPVPLKKT